MRNVLIFKENIFIGNDFCQFLEKTTKGKRQKTSCGCAFLQQDRVECLSNDILVRVLTICLLIIEVQLRISGYYL
jgi:hypothetical protein